MPLQASACAAAVATLECTHMLIPDWRLAGFVGEVPASPMP